MKCCCVQVPKPAWEQGELLSEMISVERRIAENIVKLFENENTIPFIARYRRDMTGDMSPEDLRKAKDAFETIKSIQAKSTSILKAINKIGKLNTHLERCIVGARSIVELEHLYAPYKAGGKRTKADAARQLGLEPAAMTLLEGTDYMALEPLVREDTPGRETIWEVEANISYIIADVISKDKDVLDHLRSLQQNAGNIRIESVMSKTAKSSGKEKTNTKKDTKPENLAQKKGVEEGKYELYYNFSVPVRHVKPHQVLAINRGESQKVLSVKIAVPDWLINKLHDFCKYRWLRTGYEYPLRLHFFEKSFKDAYTRLIHPLIARQVRSKLNQEAERAAIDVFATNLKKLLLTPPLRGTPILSIDPGFSNGCKAAVISSTGNVLAAEVLHINFKPVKFRPPPEDPVAVRLKQLLSTHSCELIGIGNGKGCRETEEYLSQLIQSGWFQPMDVQYTIVSEQGASIYSCSSEAIQEFPKLDRNLISAVSLARRVQDPLSEMVKVEPKHLGVGMYQHDVPEKQLNATLDEVVSECVSFVGVDINTASLSVLRKIAGLNQSRAGKILEWRECNGQFTNRQQLRLVKGIGDKTYEQCAGFVRVVPQTAQACSSSQQGKRQQLPKKQSTSVETDFNPLDQTWIHPESYSTAYRFIKKCGVDLKNLGTPHFIANVERTVRENGLTALSQELSTTEAVVRLIAEGLKNPLDHDIRSELSKPLFRRGVTSLEDLKIGIILTGRVQNVTHFGTFVDIGVGINGLIPASRLRNVTPQLGDRIEVRVFNLEPERKRIGLDLVKIL
ncbi:nucleic acid binding [Homalodisca vitripennis]|nr:nucleic acid binding [Homalodisca vitripennis]